MNIPVDPEEYDYGDDCLLCHPAGETPKNIYASFSNIKRGATWVPGDADPPNEIYKLTQIAACMWDFTKAPLYFFHRKTATSTILSITYNAVLFAFVAQPPVVCGINFTNGIVNPAGVKYYGGEATIAWIEPSEEESLAELCNLFGIPTEAQTTALMYPVTPAKQVAKLQNFEENIKISIKRDFA